ncbi:MAG: methyltransferase [Acidobacteria bacterium]|nr:methyltransferase [Acidobacteriota bacterium]
MTPRERVLAAIAHQEPDQVPIDQGSMRSTGIMAIAYNRLKRSLGMEAPPTRLYDLVQQLAQPDDWYLDRFRADAVDLGRAFEPRQGWQPWTLPDGSAATAPGWFRADREDSALVCRDERGTVIGRMPEGALYIDQAIWPLAGPDGLDHYEPLPEHMAQVIWAALPTAPFDHSLTNERLADIARTARQFHAATDRAVSVAVGCNLFEWSQFLFGMENTYLYMAGEKRKYAAFLDRLTELHLESLSRLLPSLRGAIDILVVGDDLGMQSGPQMSRAMYRELFFARHRRIYEYAKRESGAHLFLHCCGGVRELIPDLIEAGVEIFNPVQTSARRMEPERLKREFGRDCTFWGGGCDTQRTLPRGSREQIRDDVRRRMDVFAPGGGFVWAQVHNILADVPAENIVEMLDAAYEFGAA